MATSEITFSRSLEESVERINELYDNELGEHTFVVEPSGREFEDNKLFTTWRAKIKRINEDGTDGETVESLTQAGTKEEMQLILRGLEIAAHGELNLTPPASTTEGVGWPNRAEDELEFWNVVSVSPPDDWPDSVSEDDGPFAVKNVNNDTVVGVDYVPEDSQERLPDDIDQPCWMVQGPNTIHCYEPRLEDAQHELYYYVAGMKRPSPMI